MDIIFYLIMLLGAAWIIAFGSLSVLRFKAGRRSRGKLYVVLAILPAILFAALVALVECNHKEVPRRSRCMANLSQLGKAMKMYSMDHNEHFPDSLGELAPEYASNTNIFLCPQSGQKANGSLRPYVYVPSLSETNDCTFIHAYCPPGSHKGEGGNILFIDGSVSWSTSERYPSYDKDKHGLSFERTIGQGKYERPNTMPEDIGANAPHLQH